MTTSTLKNKPTVECTCTHHYWFLKSLTSFIISVIYYLWSIIVHLFESVCQTFNERRQICEQLVKRVEEIYETRIRSWSEHVQLRGSTEWYFIARAVQYVTLVIATTVLPFAAAKE